MQNLHFSGKKKFKKIITQKNIFLKFKRKFLQIYIKWNNNKATSYISLYKNCIAFEFASLPRATRIDQQK